MKPIIQYKEYMKFGFVKTRFQAFFCPECAKQLNAGPNYQPKRCENCGKALDFSKIVYEPEKTLGYVG